MKALFANKKGLELQGLYGFILLIVLVGMLIGVGIVVSESFGSATFYTRSDYNDTVAINNATHEDLDYGNITVSAVWNNTNNTLPAVCYQINTTEGTFQYINLTSGTTGCSNIDGTAFYVIYDFKEYDTATRNTMSSVTTEISNISTDWIALIVTIVILSIILGLVMVAFRPGMERG